MRVVYRLAQMFSDVTVVDQQRVVCSVAARDILAM